MATDRQIALAKALLGLVPGVKPTAEDKRLAVVTTSVILSDMVGHIQRALRERGAGIPIVLNDGSLQWRTPEDITDAIDKAVLAGDLDGQKLFRDLLDLVQVIDPELEVVIAMASSRSLRVFRIPVDDPAAQVNKLLEAWG